MEDDDAVTRRLHQAQALASLALRECYNQRDFRIVRWAMIRQSIGRDIERILQQEQRAIRGDEAKKTRLILTTRKGYQTSVAPEATTAATLLPRTSRSRSRLLTWQRRRRLRKQRSYDYHSIPPPSH